MISALNLISKEKKGALYLYTNEDTFLTYHCHDNIYFFTNTIKRDKYSFKHLKNNFEKFIHFYEKK